MFENTQGTSKANYGASGVDDYLDSMFSTGTQSNTRPSQSSTSEVITNFQEKAAQFMRAISI